MGRTNLSHDTDNEGTTRRSFLGSLGAGSGFFYLGEMSDWSNNKGKGSGTQNVKVLAGPADNRPDSTKSGRLYIAIDTGHRFYDTGDTWEPIDITAPAGEFQSATIENLIVGDIASKIGDDLASDHEEYNPHFPRLAEQSGPPVIQPHPGVSNPVLTGDDVTDFEGATYVADPFIVYENCTYHMFFEIFRNEGVPDAVIGHATSPDGLQWEYNQVVVEPTSPKQHNSFPYVFKWQNEWYMMAPESDLEEGGPDSIPTLYRADSFPTDWSFVERPITERVDYSDPVPIYWEGTWYIFSGRLENVDQSQLQLYYADSLIDGDWKVHPASPIHTGDRLQRPGGRPIVHEDYIDFFYQDNRRTYGDKVRALRITELTKNEYTDQELATSPIVEAQFNGEWNDNGMHQVDMLMPYLIENDIVAVDGLDPEGNWSIGIYTTGENGPTAARAYLSDDQSIESGNFVTVRLNQLAHDVSQSFDTDNYQYVVPSSGYYQVEGQITLVDNETESEPFTLASRLHNASANSSLAEQYTPMVANGSASSLASTTAYLNDEDAIRFQGWHDAGQALDIASSKAKTYLSIRRIR